MVLQSWFVALSTPQTDLQTSTCACAFCDALAPWHLYGDGPWADGWRSIGLIEDRVATTMVTRLAANSRWYALVVQSFGAGFWLQSAFSWLLDRKPYSLRASRRGYPCQPAKATHPSRRRRCLLTVLQLIVHHPTRLRRCCGYRADHTTRADPGCLCHCCLFGAWQLTTRPLDEHRRSVCS
jgi:hypothetical protein